MRSTVASVVARATLGFLSLSGVTALKPARAGIIYSTGFENPPYTNGSQLSGQDGWFAPSPTNPPGYPFNLNPAAAVISSTNPHTGSQSVQVRGSNLQTDANVNGATSGYYNAIGSYRHAVSYLAGTGTTTVQGDVFVSGPTTANSNFFSASVAALGTGGVGLGELAISSDGHVHAYTGDDAVPTFLFNTPITLSQWHTLAVVDDFGASKTSFYVDGSLLGTSPFASDYAGDQILNRGSIIAYAGSDSGNTLKSNYAAYYDNFSISQTPEPAAIGSLLAFAPLMARRRHARVGCGR